MKLDREILGQRVREIWVEWANEQPNPKPHWLIPWSQLSETDKEADRRIGEEIARFMELCDQKSKQPEQEPLRNTINRLTGAMEKAVNWLDMNAPGRAREELLEALKQ